MFRIFTVIKTFAFIIACPVYYSMFKREVRDLVANAIKENESARNSIATLSKWNSTSDLHKEKTTSFAPRKPKNIDFFHTLSQSLTDNMLQMFHSIYDVKTDEKNYLKQNNSFFFYKRPLNSVTKLEVLPVESYEDTLHNVSKDAINFDFEELSRQETVEASFSANRAVTDHRNINRFFREIFPSNSTINSTLVDNIHKNMSSPFSGEYIKSNKTLAPTSENVTFTKILKNIYDSQLTDNVVQFKRYLPDDIFSNNTVDIERRYGALLSYLEKDLNYLDLANKFVYISKNKSFGYFGNQIFGYFSAYPHGYFPNGSYGFFPGQGISIRNATGNTFTNAIYFNFPNNTMAFYIPFTLRQNDTLYSVALMPKTPTIKLNPNKTNIKTPLQPLKNFISIFFNATNVINKVKNIAVPINSTPGINDVTYFFQKVITPSERQGIIRSFEEKEALARKRNNIVQQVLNSTDRAIHEAFNYTSNSQRIIDPFIKDYNAIVDWEKNLPFFSYDEFMNVFKDYASEYSKLKTNATLVRDEIYAALLEAENMFFSIPGKPINNTYENLQYAMDKKYESITPLFTPVSDLLLTWRENISKLQYIFIVQRAAAKICALNPICCDEPLSCSPFPSGFSLIA